MPALAVESYLESPAAEARAKNLFNQIRCLVCAGEAIADSKAELAQDLREIIRNDIRDGMGDEAILASLTTRYGEQILMTPPVNLSTLLLWGMPLLLLAAGGVVALSVFRKRS
jgi:cytochrome c-type biogenesis protein CcmH